MQHAPTLLVALERLLALPELSWGHCRITVLSYAAGAVVQFEPPILPHGIAPLPTTAFGRISFPSFE